MQGKLNMTYRSQGKVIQKKSGSSLYVGVRTQRYKWAASIAYQKKHYWLGTFSTQEEAARAYDRKARELYGDAARLNFPNEVTP